MSLSFYGSSNCRWKATSSANIGQSSSSETESSSLSQEVRSCLKRSDFQRYKMSLCELDKEIETCKTTDSKKFKILKIVILIFELVALALFLITPVLSMFGIPFWIPFVATLAIWIGTRVVNYKCTVKKNLIETRYKSLLLYRKQLEKCAPKFESTWKKYGLDIVSESSEQEGFSKVLKKLMGQDDSEALDKKVSIEDSLDLASSGPFLRRYQTDELAGFDNRVSNLWNIYKQGIRQSHVYAEAGRFEEAILQENETAQNALLQTGGIDLENIPLEDHGSIVETVKRFCAYSVQVLFDAEKSMQNFERVFRGCSFLPESQLVLQDIRSLRDEFLDRAGMLHHYFQRISQAQTEGSLPAEVELLESLKSDSTLLSAKFLIRKSEKFHQSLNAKIAMHPENLLSELRSSIKNAEVALSEDSWGTNYMSYNQIVEKKKQLEMQIELLKNELSLIEQSYSDFKKNCIFKNLFNETKEVLSLVVQQSNLSESDYEFLEQVSSRLVNLEQMFSQNGGIDRYEAWTLQYADIIQKCQTFKSVCLKSVLDDVFSDGSSLGKRVRRVLFTKESQIEDQRTKTLETIKRKKEEDPSSVVNKTVLELSTSLSLFLNSLEESCNDLKTCSLDDAGRVPVICKTMSDIYGSLDVEELSILKKKLWDNFIEEEPNSAEEIEASQLLSISLDPSNLDAEIKSLLDKGIHLEEVSKKIFASHVEKIQTTLSTFARSKQALDALIKSEEKSIKKSVLIKSLLACLIPVALLVLAPLLISLEIWWMPLLFTGMIVLNLAGDCGLNYLIAKKKKRAQEIRMARTIAEHTEVFVPDISNSQNKALARLSQTLGLDGTTLTVGKNLADSMLECPFDYTEKGVADSRKKEIKRLKSDMAKAVSKAPFKIGAYVAPEPSSSVGLTVPEVQYTSEQKSQLQNLRASLDGCDVILQQLDRDLDSLVDKKIDMQEEIASFKKRQHRIQALNSQFSSDMADMENLKDSVALASYRQTLVNRALNIVEETTEDKTSHVKEGIENCITFYTVCTDPKEYQEQMVALFKQHEKLGTVNLLIDDLELLSVRKIKDVKYIERKPTCLKDKLEVMGNPGLVDFLDFANNSNSRENLKNILAEISTTQETSSSRYKLLSLQAIGEINRLQESLNRLEQTTPSTLFLANPGVEQLSVDMSELRNLAERLIKDSRVSRNDAADRALKALKAFRRQRFAHYKEKSSYKRLLKNLTKYLKLIKKEPEKTSQEVENSLLQCFVGLPGHVLKEEFLDLQLTISKDSDLFNQKKQKTAIFSKMKMDFYGKTLEEAIDNAETTRAKLIELQNLQAKLLEIDQSREALIQDIRVAKAEKQQIIDAIKIIHESVNSQALPEETDSIETSSLD